uniref:hypothetical protein n=1 Tax=Paenibacillus xylanexedens TaxID=528191 RepID=UPI001C930AC6
QNGNNYMVNGKKIVIGGDRVGGKIRGGLVLMCIKNEENVFLGVMLEYGLLEFGKIEKKIIDCGKGM